MLRILPYPLQNPMKYIILFVASDKEITNSCTGTEISKRLFIGLSFFFNSYKVILYRYREKNRNTRTF